MFKPSQMDSKTFHQFLEVPQELRKPVANRMRSDSRKRAPKVQTSRFRPSPIQFYTFELDCRDSEDPQIHVRYCDTLLHNGFTLDFMKIPQGKYIFCRNLMMEVMWEYEIAEYTDLLDKAIYHFKYLLQYHHNIVKKLHIWGPPFKGEKYKYFDFGIEKLEHLEELNVDCEVIQIMSKTRKPLKLLFDDIEDNGWKLPLCKEIYLVQADLFLPHLQLNYTQFLRLSASRISINIGHLTEENIIEFIMLWQEGISHQKLKICEWNCRNSNFRTRKLFRILESDISQRFSFKHDHHRGIGVLDADLNSFTFRVNWNGIRERDIDLIEFLY